MLATFQNLSMLKSITKHIHLKAMWFMHFNYFANLKKDVLLTPVGKFMSGFPILKYACAHCKNSTIKIMIHKCSILSDYLLAQLILG